MPVQFISELKVNRRNLRTRLKPTKPIEHFNGMSTSLKTVDFEVFGCVQKVFFRKCTQEQGKQLGLRGWCQNTPQGTVIGTIQGPPDKVVEMIKWLREVGSPASRIDKVELKNENSISDFTYLDFDIVRKKV